jgi:hypothetical protein
MQHPNQYKSMGAPDMQNQLTAILGTVITAKATNTLMLLPLQSLTNQSHQP